MTTVHLVYPHGPRISCPDAIGRHLGQRLEQHYAVVYHNWDEPGVIKPQPGDVLLGHPHPNPWTCFRQSLSQLGWGRIIALSPYHHGDAFQAAFLDSVIARCHLYLAVTGNYWYSTVDNSLFAHWLPKMVHVDLAVDRQDFPVLKTQFSPPGRRQFVYIGHSGWTKNTAYLSEIAAAMPEVSIDWIGSGRRPIPGLRRRGFRDFSVESGRQDLGGYDFMLTVGKADANPATILEAMAWGLIPVCTPQSGYCGYPGIVNVPLADAHTAAAVLRQLQELPEEKLNEMRTGNWEALNTHFNWDRFSRQVCDAIESEASPPLGPVSPRQRLRLRWSALVGPNSPGRPRNLMSGLARPWIRRLRRAQGPRQS